MLRFTWWWNMKVFMGNWAIFITLMLGGLLLIEKPTLRWKTPNYVCQHMIRVILLVQVIPLCYPNEGLIKIQMLTNVMYDISHHYDKLARWLSRLYRDRNPCARMVLCWLLHNKYLYVKDYPNDGAICFSSCLIHIALGCLSLHVPLYCSFNHILHMSAIS